MTGPVPKPMTEFTILNAEEARFDCIFGRGCDGICCRNGRPPVYPEESQLIDANLDKFLPALRPESRQVVQKVGYLSKRRKIGLPMMRVVKGWCVFFNRGCVLHQIGAAEGDKFRYKPAICALFPIDRDKQARWYVRQKGFNGEIWDLFCLDPKSTSVRAVDSVQDEIALARRYTLQEEEASE